MYHGIFTMYHGIFTMYHGIFTMSHGIFSHVIFHLYIYLTVFIERVHATSEYIFSIWSRISYSVPTWRTKSRVMGAIIAFCNLQKKDACNTLEKKPTMNKWRSLVSKDFRCRQVKIKCGVLFWYSQNVLFCCIQNKQQSLSNH